MEDEKKKKVGLILFFLFLLIVIFVLMIILIPIMTQKSGFLDDGMILNKSVCSKLGEGIIFIYSESCAHCQKMEPIMKDFNVTYLELYSNLSYLNGMGLYPKAVPTIIIKCKVHLGEMTKEQIENA